jgi:adenosylcobinamide-phosphate synthase
VFGTIAWFLVAGAPGAILYRLAGVLDEQWDAGSEPRTEEFGRFARRCFFWLDWIPARLTAASFAIAGNFEDAVYRWRTQASSWVTEAHVIILAAGGGALGARLGGHVSEAEGAQYDPGPDIDAAADVDDMRSAVGLVWRALVLWMTLILVVTVAHALG